MPVSDYFAELYVAGRFADAGWNVYFPHRDEGFDFIAVKATPTGPLIRPVQVKGKYPMNVKSNKAVYGYVGRLTQTHSEMVLAIPYFPTASINENPLFVAYMPWSMIRGHSRGYRSQPARYTASGPEQRPGYALFFDSAGLQQVERPGWSTCGLEGVFP